MRVRYWFATAAVYALAAIALTWPLAVHLTDRLGALQGPGDPYLNLWILGWGLQAWTTDPLSVFSGRVFDANIFYPAEHTLAYSDHFLLQALALSPVYALTGDAVLCYNLLVLVSITLSGLAMHALARAVTGSTPGASLAGLAWACWPYRSAHLLHIQLQALYFMPLALLFLHRVVAGRRWRDAGALGVTMAAQAVSSVYYGLMTALVLVTSGVTLAVMTGQWRSRRLWTRLAAGAALAAALTLPILIPYARAQQSEGFARTLFEAAHHSASIGSYFQVPPTNLLYNALGLMAPRAPRAGERDRTGEEYQLFPGFVLIALAAVAVWRNRTNDRRPVLFTAAALATLGVILSLGPEGVRGVYAALHEHVYGFQAIRAPARFAVIAVLGLTLLAALGVRSLTAPPSRHGPLAVALVAAACVEYANGPLALAPAPARTTDVGQWLKSAPETGAVVHLPLTIDIAETRVMVQSLEHRRPIVNGYSGQRPAFYSAVVDALADMPSAVAHAALNELDVRYVVSESPIAGAGGPSSPLLERARLSGGIVYEVRWTPEALVALDAVTAPDPPPPGPAPFAAGETAVYDVHWDGGPLNVPAGRATLRVLEGRDGGDRWMFEATAETADWVSSFFEARDRFTTIADGRLEPLEHARVIREGRRTLERTYVFDREARVVRVGESAAAARDPAALALPLERGITRDAVTALYYARTLTLTPGTTITLPINEAGANLVLQVAAGEPEMLAIGGGLHRTIRLEPRVMRRIERRRPLVMSVWLSDDRRRLPLRVVVEAGFGRVRADLVDYRP